MIKVCGFKRELDGPTVKNPNPSLEAHVPHRGVFKYCGLIFTTHLISLSSGELYCGDYILPFTSLFKISQSCSFKRFWLMDAEQKKNLFRGADK